MKKLQAELFILELIAAGAITPYRTTIGLITAREDTFPFH